MQDFDGGVLTIGMGSAAIMPSQVQRSAPPTKEVVPAGAGWLPRWNYALPWSIDDLTRQFGPKTYEAMLFDAAVSSSYNNLKLSILSGGITLKSPVKQPAWSKRPDSGAKAPPAGGAVPPKPGAKDDPSTPPAQPDRQLSPDQKLAAEVLEFCEWNCERARQSIAISAWELTDAMAFGNKMAEVTFEPAPEGKWAGKLCLQSVKVKPNWAWRFVVDSRLNVVGFLTYNPLGGYIVYPPEKFVWLSWMPKDSDPRGTSCLRAAYVAWNLKVQAWPMYYAFLKRFGAPGLDYTMAEGDVDEKPSIDANGALLNDGNTMAPGVFYATLLGVYQAGGVFVHPHDSVLQIAEPKSKGEALVAGIDLWDRQITLAIEHQVRAKMESQHGSKADSETAQDSKGLITQYGRDWLADCYFRAFKQLVRLNYGDDAADRMTPRPTFGGTENQDRGELWSAAASIGFKIGPSQLEDMDDELGLPIRDPVADAEQAAAQLKMVADATGDTIGAGSDKPPQKGPKPKPGGSMK